MSSEELLQLPFFYRAGQLTIRKAPRDKVPFAVFEGTIPTQADAHQITQSGYGLHIVGSPDPQLGFLTMLHGLRYLSIVGEKLDTRSVGQLRSLISLEMMVGEAPSTDLSGLSELEAYFGVYGNFDSVLQAPSIKSAEFHEVGVREFAPVPSGLQKLTLMRARRVGRLDAVTADRALEYLYIHGAKEFDAASLSSFANLQTVIFEGVGAVKNVDRLQELRLRTLAFDRCRAVEGLNSLSDLKNLSVYITGKLGEQLSEFASVREGRWELRRR